MTKTRHHFNPDMLRYHRQRLGLTYQALADRVGTTKGYLWELEHGCKRGPSYNMAVELSLALQVSLSTFRTIPPLDGDTP